MNAVDAYKLGLKVAPRVPLRLGYALCRLAGLLVYLLNRNGRRAVQSNLRHVLGRAAGKGLINRLARGVFVNNFKNYFDMLRLESLTDAQVREIVTVEGSRHMDEALAQGKGAIMYTAHLGNFNLIIQLPTALGYKFSLFAEPVEPPELYDLLTRLRESHGVKLIPVGTAAIMQGVRALKRNEILGIAADRDITGSGREVMFFDAPTRLPVGTVQLAARMGAVLIPALIYRRPDNRSHAVIYPPLPLDNTGDAERDISTNLRKVAATMEAMIARYPDQWVVLQDVWAGESEK